MTRPTFFVEEDKILSTLFDEGMDGLHLNKPTASPMYSERLLSLLPDFSYSKITVHDHYYLKAEYKLGGIHLDDENMTLPKDYKGDFSRTCHDISKLSELKKKAKYVFLDNTFVSSGNDNMIGRTYQELENAARHGLIDKHVFAYGGVNIENIKIAKEFGFGGVVVCEDLWNKFDIHNEQDYKELINHFEKLRKTIS